MLDFSSPHLIHKFTMTPTVHACRVTSNCLQTQLLLAHTHCHAAADPIYELSGCHVVTLSVQDT